MSDTQTKAPVPLSVLTGFLGAGKTTLLNTLLQDPAMEGTAVIINEFGEIGLDHLLVETADENVMEMSSGCLCCTIRGDLIDTMIDLMTRRDEGRVKDFDRVVIETTGLADPAPILHTIMNHPWLLARYRLESVITLVDAVNGEATLDAHVEAVKQVAMADRLVLSKADLLEGLEGEEKFASLVVRLRKLAPAARILDTLCGEATPEKLFNAGLYDPESKSPDVKRWLAEEAYGVDRNGHGHGHGHDHHHDVNRHDDHISAFCIASDLPISAPSFDLFLELRRSYHGPNLLRVKGIVKVEEDQERPFIIHGVQHVFHPPVQLDAWPDEDRRSRLVFITRDVQKAELEKIFAAFAERSQGAGAAFRDETLSLRSGGLLEE
ncbi:MAG: GTP-binding protein [Pseudomonadota bacterium]